jgi:hypothetical protein
MGETNMFKRRTSLALLLVLTALVLGFSAAFAQGVEYIYPFGGTVTVSSQDEIHVQWFWLAQTKGLIRSFLGHSSESYALTGLNGLAWSMSPQEAEEHWGLVSTITNPEDFIVCPKPTYSFVGWEATLPDLDPGTYTLALTQVLDQPVNDGWHTCVWADTGEPAATPPSLYRGTSVYATTIIVE